MHSKLGSHGTRFLRAFGVPDLAACASITAAALSLVLATGCDSHGLNSQREAAASEPAVAPRPAASDRSHRTQEVEIGTIPINSTRDYAFTIANDGSEEWILKDIHTSCSCTVASPDRAIIAPGESVCVKIQYHAPADSHEVLRDTLVKFEPGPTFKLILRGSVRAPLAVSATHVDFRSRVGEKVAAKRLEVTNYTEHDFADLKASASASWLHVKRTLVKSSAKPKGFGLRQVWSVELTPDATELVAGYHNAQLSFQEVPFKPSSPQTITASAGMLVEARLSATPASLLFASPSSGGPCSRDLTITAALSDPTGSLTVSVSDSLSQELSVNKISSDGHVCRYKVTWTPATSGGTPNRGALRKGTIRFQAGPGKLDAVAVPVFLSTTEPLTASGIAGK
jgi:hypothetical protein